MTKLIWITPKAEEVIAYCARVSSNYQDNPEYKKLFNYLVEHGHWSPFEMASMCVEITTTLPIATQLLRHRSFSFQQFSNRYNSNLKFSTPTARRQDKKSRQASIDDLDPTAQAEYTQCLSEVTNLAVKYYNYLGNKYDIAREYLRFLLPQNNLTKLYMSGTIRSWIHYVQLRTKEDTQPEHRKTAKGIMKIIKQELPIIGELL